MLAVVGAIMSTVVVVDVLLKLHQVVIWIAISSLIAVVLHPAVNFLVRQLKMRRALAAIVVFLVGTVLVAGLGYLFIRPIVDQVNTSINNFSTYVTDARAGKGTIGHLVKKYDIVNYVDQNQQKLENDLKTAEKPAEHVASGLLNTLTALATIVVVTFLLLIEGPNMLEGGLGMLSPPIRERVSNVIKDVVRALAGYMGGVLATSVIAGVVAYFSLWALGIPFRGVLALWIGFTAFIPLVGVILGVLPAAIVGVIHSTPAGVAIVVIIIGFHLIENRTLGKRINARTIALSPLAVAVSLLAGFQLLGFLGVFLAIPAAGVIHVVSRDVWRLRHPDEGQPDGAIT
jgi:predicted PurR-regulated permease PerM